MSNEAKCGPEPQIITTVRLSGKDLNPEDFIASEVVEGEISPEEPKEVSEEVASARNRLLVSAKELVQTKNVGRQFLIGPDLFPKHGRMLITGKTGTGKSTLTLYMAACLASKAPLFNITHTHNGSNKGLPKFPIMAESAVLYLDYELPPEIRAEKRLKPLASHLPESFQRRLLFPPHPSLYRLHNQEGEAKNEGSFDGLKKLIAETRPDVLIIDPLSSAHSLDENTIEVKQALNNADSLIDQYGCSVVLVHHATTKTSRNKDGELVEKDAIEQPRGHSSLVDWCDVHIHFAADTKRLSRDEDEEDEAKDRAAESVV